MKNKWIKWALDVLFPPRCAYCNKVLSHETVCEECKAALPRILPPVCMRCGLPVELCGCNRKKRRFDSIAAPFLYEGNVASAIKRFKFNEKPQLARPLAEELAGCFGQYYENETIDFVCAVPMHPKKDRERGYNQSELLAKEAAALLRLPYRPHLLKKTADTKAQHGLSSHLREGNVLGVFEADESVTLQGKRVLLIDDVKTTGATLNECAKVLKLAGAGRVFALCVAITREKRRPFP